MTDGQGHVSWVTQSMTKCRNPSSNCSIRGCFNLCCIACNSQGRLFDIRSGGTSDAS